MKNVMVLIIYQIIFEVVSLFEDDEMIPFFAGWVVK